MWISVVHNVEKYDYFILYIFYALYRVSILSLVVECSVFALILTGAGLPGSGDGGHAEAGHLSAEAGPVRLAGGCAGSHRERSHLLLAWAHCHYSARPGCHNLLDLDLSMRAL